MPGIPRNPTLLIPKLREAAEAIRNTVNWPATAPTDADLDGAANLLELGDTRIEETEDQLRLYRQQRREAGEQAYELMKRVDLNTSAMYGETSNEKLRYGVEAAQAPGEPPSPPPLRKLVIVVVRDGVLPASLFVDFDSIRGAVYEVECHTNANLTALVQTKTVTASEATIDGLIKGTQYWIRVRAVRGSEVGPWSDPATRVAGV